MKKSLKCSALLWAGALILAAGFGCGGRPEDSGGNIAEGDMPSDVVVSANGKEIYVGAKENKTRLKISYTLAGYGSDWIKVLSANFVHDNPEYWIFLDGDSGLTETLSTKLETGLNLSDLYMPLSSHWEAFASGGWLADLSDVYDAKPEGEEKTVYEKTNDSWQQFCQAEYLGKTGKYAFPWTETITGFAYNASMFERYGWEVPETVDEFIALCDKIKADTGGKVAPIVYPGAVGGYFDFIAMSWWLQSSGVEGLKEFFSFSSPDVYGYTEQPGLGKYQMLETFTSIFGPDKNYSLKGSMSKNHTEAQLSFLRGEAAMIPNASWLESEMKDDLPDGFRMKLMRTPYASYAQKDESGEYKKYSYAATADYMIVPAKADNVEGAKKFLVYTSSEDMLKMFTKYTGTPRPFEYDVMNIYSECTEFTQSCLDIWATSESYFDMSTNILYKKDYAKKFITQSPYAALVYGPDNDGTTPLRFCKQEYQEARGNWQTWLDYCK